MMNDEFQLAPLPPDADTAEMLEAIGPLEERPAESQYCVFRSGRERFCLPVLDVEEVLEWPIVTRLPLGPSYLMGIFNLRGAIVPLIDIAMTEGRRPGLLPKHVVVASMRVEGSNEIAIEFNRLDAGHRQWPGALLRNRTGIPCRPRGWRRQVHFRLRVAAERGKRWRDSGCAALAGRRRISRLAPGQFGRHASAAARGILRAAGRR